MARQCRCSHSCRRCCPFAVAASYLAREGCLIAGEVAFASCIVGEIAAGMVKHDEVQRDDDDADTGSAMNSRLPRVRGLGVGHEHRFRQDRGQWRRHRFGHRCGYGLSRRRHEGRLKNQGRPKAIRLRLPVRRAGISSARTQRLLRAAGSGRFLVLREGVWVPQRRFRCSRSHCRHQRPLARLEKVMARRLCFASDE